MAWESGNVGAIPDSVTGLLRDLGQLSLHLCASVLSFVTKGGNDTNLLCTVP